MQVVTASGTDKAWILLDIPVCFGDGHTQTYRHF